MIASQKTLAKAGSVTGVGIHSGRPCTVTLRPAAAGAGYKFFRKGSAIDATPDPAARRCTAVGRGEERIDTVEHLLAALCGLGVSNAEIDADGPELPALDGSAAPYAALIRSLGLVDQNVPAGAYRLRAPIFCSEGTSALMAYPAEEFSVSYVLDYDHPALRNQRAEFTPSREAFEAAVAPARTFCTDAEARILKEKGFGLGADATNTLVVSEKGPVNGSRFPNECARHKVLDLVGDLGLLGFPLTARVVGIRSGHSLNRKLVEAIRQQRETAR